MINYSNTHNIISSEQILYFSLDLEHAGEVVGIVQLSTVCHTLDGVVLGEFNKFIKPIIMDETQWSSYGNSIRPQHDYIQKGVVQVFNRWKLFMELFLLITVA